MEETRLCHGCGLVLPVSEFYQRKTRPNEKINFCKKCVCEQHKAYAKTHPEKIKEISARGREKHREEIRQRNRDFYNAHKDDPKYKESVRRSREKNGEKWRGKDRERRKRFNEKWKHPCEKCGEDRLYLIQFHHIDPGTKSFCIGASATSRQDAALEAEVKKCVCLCSNCHDEFHYFYGGNPEHPVEALEEYLGRKVAL